MDAVLSLVSAALMLIGALFALAAAIGIVRLPDLYTRMHAAAKAGSVGSGLMLLALAAHSDLAIATRAIAALVFFLLTAPISAHLLAKAAYSVGYRMADISIRDDMKGQDRRDGEDG